MELLTFVLGFICALCGVWLGFYLGRLGIDERPVTISAPQTFGSSILDAAVYEDEKPE